MKHCLTSVFQRIAAPLLALLFMALFALEISAQNPDTLSYRERMGKALLADTTDNVDIHLYGITTLRSLGEEDMPLVGVTITMRDLYGETEQVTSDDSAFYSLDLAFDNEYQVYFEYEGMYTKFLEIDTRDVIDIEQERGYLLPTDMSLQVEDDSRIATLYLKKPVGRLYYDRRLQMLTWDLDYTDRLKSDVDKIKSKKRK